MQGTCQNDDNLFHQNQAKKQASRHSNFPTERLSHGFQQRGASISELTKPVADSKATYLTKHVPWSTAELKLSISFFLDWKSLH